MIISHSVNKYPRGTGARGTLIQEHFHWEIKANVVLKYCVIVL